MHVAIKAQPSLTSRQQLVLGKLVCKGTNEEQPSTGTTSSSPPAQDNNLAVSLGIAALWVALLGYAFYLAPNQTPYRDMSIIKLIVGLTTDDTYRVTPVFYSLFNLMGVYPLIYACLMIPAGRSENKVPAWPFVVASMFAGIFALLPYMAIWRPIQDQQLPPPKEELEGWNRLFMKGAETVVLPGMLMAGTLYLLSIAFSATGEDWVAYSNLFEESRLVHVTSLDFALCTGFIPFWMSNDAEARKWEGRDKYLPVLSLLPLIGPIVYLMLRPKTSDAPSS